MASNSFTRLMIKVAANVGGLFMAYSIYDIYRREKNLKKYEALKEHKRKLGQELTDADYDKEDKQYIDQHQLNKRQNNRVKFDNFRYHNINQKKIDGRKLAERVYTQHLAEDQIKMAIQRKKQMQYLIFIKQKDVREKMKENLDEEQLKQVDEEIKKLDEAFTKLKPKVVPRMAQFVTDKDR